VAIVLSVCCDILYRTVETVDDTSPVIDAKARRWSRIAIFAYPPAFNAALGGGGPRRNIAITFGTEKTITVWLSNGEKIEDTLIRVDRIRVRDGRTDRQTDTARRHRPRLCIASRGKKIVTSRMTSHLPRLHACEVSVE